MFKKLLALMLALIMTVSVLPTAAFAADSGVTEPAESTLDGSPSSDDAQPSEDAATGEDKDNADGESTPDGSPSPDETLPSEEPNGAEENTFDALPHAPGLPGGEDEPTEEPTDAPEPTEEPTDDPEPTEEPAGEPAPEDGESGIETVSISVKPTSAQTTYLKNYAGTYVTEKQYIIGDTTYEGGEWTIVIADDGSNIQLFHNGEDTGATVTKLDGTITGITFSKEGEWYTEKGENQTLTFSFKSDGYIAMPTATVYKNGGTEVLYNFSEKVLMYNQTKAREFFTAFQGTYTLPDGSGWEMTVDNNGDVTMSCGDSETTAFVDYMTINSSDHKTVKAVVFSSPDWYSSGSKKAPYQTLQLNWTSVTSTKTFNHFKVNKDTTFYKADGTVLRGFYKYSYFMPAEGMYSFEYFSGEEGKYVGDYALSAAYGNVYGGDIDGIGDWKIKIDGNGHVYLYTGEEEQREAVMSSVSTGPYRVKEMYVCVPGWYTDKACAIPAFIKLTWNFDTSSKVAKLYFTSEALAVYKPGKNGATGSSAVAGRIPTLRFELLGEGTDSKNTEFAKSKLIGDIDENGVGAYVGKYIVNDDSGEYIEIKADGSVVLCTGDQEYTPLYYELTDAKWLAGKEGTDVKSVVFSAPNWFDVKKKAADADRQTVTMTWSAANLQFTAEEKTCYEENSEEVVRTYTANTKYNTEESLKEAAAYFDQYVKGVYTLNDGSKWKIKAAQDESGNWTIYIDFDGDGEYEPVANPAPVFAFDKSHTATSSSEWGNDGRYLSTITVPVPGWYTDEACTRDAIVTLDWNGKLTNPIDDHQFNVEPIPLYREGTDGEVECKYFAGTFYSDTDRARGEAFLKSLGIAGTYRPTEAEGQWYIEIGEGGTVTVHAIDSRGEEHAHSDVAMDLTIDKSTTTQGDLHINPNYGRVNAVTHIKVVIPEWRTVKTNDTLANIAQCGEVTFTFTRDTTYVASSYFTPSNSYIYDDANDDGNPWEVVTKKNTPGYEKPLSAKLYTNDRAYSDANKEAAKAYFAEYAGTYFIEDADWNYMITVTEDGEIYWGDYASGEAKLPADVHFDAIRDENGDGKVSEDETEPVPGTISVWLNGYTTNYYTTSTTEPHYKDGTQRADFTWNDTDETDIENTAHKFKTSGKSAAKGYLAGDRNVHVTFDLNKYYGRGADVAAEDFAKDGTYETTDAEFRIEIETVDGNTTYNFYRPDVEAGYPLKLFGTGNAAYLRGKIGQMKKNDVYLVVTKGPYEGFLLTAYEVTYNDLNGKPQNSSNAPTVTLPLGTRFTDYSMHDTPGNIHVVNESTGKDEKYTRLSLALHDLKDGDTIYLEDDIKVGFAAKLPDGVGEVTIDGQGHTIARDSYVNPAAILMDPKMGNNKAVMSILMNPGISLMALERGVGGSLIPEEHYTGAILQVGAEDTVTLKNITIDGEGNWEIDQAKLEEAIELNKDYDIVVTDELGGHPIKELEGNVVSTDSLIKVNGGTLILEDVTLENFFAGDGYDDDRHFIDFMSKEDGELRIVSETVFKHNASRSGVCIGNTDKDEIRLSNCTTMTDNYCFGGNGGMVVAMEGTQVYMEDGTKIIGNVAADTNGVFIQLHKKTDGQKDGDNKGDVYSKLHMDGGTINENIGLRGGSYGWGQVVYLYNGGAFEMNGGEIGKNIGAGISSIYQQPSADALKLNAGWIHDNTCSLTDEGMDSDWALDIALMNIGNVGKEGDDPEHPAMIVEQNFVVGAAAILGGYASGDEYLTNNGVIKGNISVYSYFNNEGNVTTVVNNNLIEGDIRLENGSMVKNGEEGVITGNVTVRGALTGSAGESSFHNEGRVNGKVELAEGAHLYNSGELYGDVTVKSGATLEMNCNDGHMEHTGTIFGNVTVYPSGLLYANVTPTRIEGTITFEYEDEEDRRRMEDVLKDCGITYDKVVYVKHKHSEPLEETVIEPDDEFKCTDPCVKTYTCKTCGEVVKTEEIPAPGEHEYYVYSITEATCTTGEVEHIRCRNCSAYNSTSSSSEWKELKRQVKDPLGHKYVELENLYIPPTEYGSGHIYYVCTECGDLLEFEINAVHNGKTRHSFQDEAGALIESAGRRTKEPTCTEDGVMTFTCTDCGTTITTVIPAMGHLYPDPDDTDKYIVIDSDDSTCTKPGYIKYAPQCSRCDEIDETYTYQVTLPKLGHEWPTDENGNEVWTNVDDTIQYPCTMEREQIRQCIRENCDDLTRTGTETRQESEKEHDWQTETDDDGNEIERCRKCSMVKDGKKVVYNRNGGGATMDFIAKTKMTYEPGTTVTLWQPADETGADANAGITEDKHWIKTTALGSAVFVGWSTVDCGAEPHYEKPADADIVTEVAVGAEDVPVYAVWALDRNGNNIADYEEENKATLEYDANGGSGDLPAKMENLLIGGSYPLVTECGLTKGGNVFAGWSTTRTDLVIPEADTTITIAADDAGNPVSRVTWGAEPDEKSVDLITSPYRIPTPTSGNTVTLYAVYAAPDGAGKPAFDDNFYHVEYYAPGAEGNRDYTVDEAKGGLFYTCNDHHEPNSPAALLTLDAASVMVYRPGAVLVGFTDNEDWNKAEQPFITSASEESVLIEEIQIPEDENAKVYAVWAADENSNGIRDYNEDRARHEYFLNEYLSEHQSDGSNKPMEPDKDDAGEDLTEDHLRISSDNSKKRPEGQLVLYGQYIRLAESDAIGAADLYSADGNTLIHHYVQIGWSKESHGVVQYKSEAENWVLGYGLSLDGKTEDENGYLDTDGCYYREIRDEQCVSAYAVWAFDDNDDGDPDFLPEESDSPASVPGVPTGPDETGCDGGEDCPSRDYVDVDHSLWYHESVDYVVENKLMTGTGELTFAPNGVTTRAEAVVVLYRMEGAPAVTTAIPFEDVPDGQWYSDAINWAAANGIVFGYGNGRFGPDNAVTREQMAAILYRYAGYKGYDMTKLSDLVGYTDAGAVSDWALPAVKWVVGAGVVEGTDAATLDPSGDSTRAQTATIFMNFRRKFVS